MSYLITRLASEGLMDGRLRDPIPLATLNSRPIFGDNSLYWRSRWTRPRIEGHGEGELAG